MACGCQRCSAGHSAGPASDPEYLSSAPARDKPRRCRWFGFQAGGSSSRWTPRRHFGGLLLHLHGLRSSADQTQTRLHRRDCLLGHPSHRSLRALPRLSIHNSTRECSPLFVVAFAHFFLYICECVLGYLIIRDFFNEDKMKINHPVSSWKFFKLSIRKTLNAVFWCVIKFERFSFSLII